jgi:ABC-type transport system substrate-binding protein
VPELLIAIRSTGFYQAEAELLGVLLSRFGIKSKVEVYTTATLTSRTDAGQFDIQTTGPGLTVLDPINVIQQAYLSDTSATKDKWVTAQGDISPAQKRVNELYDQYLRTPDVAGRKTALHELQRQIYAETYQVPLAYPKMWIPVYNDVKGVFVMGLYEGWDRENLWFDR